MVTRGAALTAGLAVWAVAALTTVGSTWAASTLEDCSDPDPDFSVSTTAAVGAGREFSRAVRVPGSGDLVAAGEVPFPRAEPFAD
jgi:hypothetical protein